jgi:uncharacterized protein
VKVVLDTNVLMSGIFTEYRRVAAHLESEYGNLEIGAILDLLVSEGILIEDEDLGEQVSDDTDDDKFLACASASGARVIVSGDKHLLAMNGWRGIEVLKPATYRERYLRG